MFWSVATVFCYSASSLGDKFISAKLKCAAPEFSFLVGLSTAVFLALLLPFSGWAFAFTWGSVSSLSALTVLKIAEFYTSALLLKHVSAYELKAWLSLNVIFSYLADLARGTAVFFAAILPCAVLLFGGVLMAARSERRGGGAWVLCLAYIASKFLYGFVMNTLPAGTAPVSVLILVMLIVAAAQLPFLKFRLFFRKKGLAAGALTRIPNALGLWTEAMAAGQSLLLYALVQPMQLALLLLAAAAGREKIGREKLLGTVFTLAAVCAATVLIYFYGRQV